ncbi:MAG TPA: TolC family protein [Bacteroidota bacterium]|nr:TolC family protein [Bacteroidota bacterium]
MIKRILVVILLLAPLKSSGQQDSVVVPESPALDLLFLVAEAMVKNPEIQEALYDWEAKAAQIPQAGGLPYPELKFAQEEMPGFRFNEASYSRIELMQTIPFPAKLGSKRSIGATVAEHAHHDHLEKINDIVSRLRRAYYELWFIQQSIVLERENQRLLRQFESIARTRYVGGQVSQQDVLQAQVELAMASRELLSLRQKEMSAKAMLMSILNRNEPDTLGFAVIPETVSFKANLDSLIGLGLHNRPMVLHDSLRIDERNERVALAREEYLPDFTLGIERVTSPLAGFSGWSVRAGITLPFAPWTLAKVSAGVEEASASVNAARSAYRATRLMVTANIKDLFYRADAFKRQLDLYRAVIIPLARQRLNLGLASYQTAQTDFLMLIDAYRTYVDQTRDYFMTRMNFDQTVADLEREVGSASLSVTK